MRERKEKWIRKYYERENNYKGDMRERITKKKKLTVKIDKIKERNIMRESSY